MKVLTVPSLESDRGHCGVELFLCSGALKNEVKVNRLVQAARIYGCATASGENAPQAGALESQSDRRGDIAGT